MAISRISVKDQIYEIIKGRILSGEYPLGEKINILSLTQELGVSNTPIREAISMLDREGLVDIRPNAGPSVMEFSRDKFFAIEKTVEMMILGSLDYIEHSGKSDYLIDKLEESLDKQVASYQSMDAQEYAFVSMEFDKQFIIATDNEYMLKMYLEIADIFTLIVLYDHTVLESDRLRIIEEHRAIMEAVKNNDFDNARKQIVSHYDKMDKGDH